MKRIISLVLALSMLLGIGQAYAAEVISSGSCGENVTWTLYDDGKLLIEGTGKMTKDIDGSDRPKVRKVVFAEGVTGISERLFNNSGESYPLLEEVSFSSTMTDIGINPFIYCNQLKKLSVSAGNPNYTSADQVLFNKDKTQLLFCAGGKEGSYEVPSTVTGLQEEAFFDCQYLTDITLPTGLQELGVRAFYRCYALRSATVPAGITELPKSVFEQCKSLKSVTLSKGIRTVGVWAFWGCVSLQEITLPDGVKAIEDEALANCPMLTSAVIPDSVTTFGSKVFDGDSIVVIVCSEGSPADQYARSNGLQVSYDGTYSPDDQSEEDVPVQDTITAGETVKYEDSATVPGALIEGAFTATSTNEDIAKVTAIARGGNIVFADAVSYFFSVWIKGNSAGTATIFLWGNEGTTLIWQKTVHVTSENPEVGDSFVSGGLKYQVTGVGDKGTVTFTGLETANSKKSVTIPAAVMYKNVSFKVTTVADNALKKDTQAATVTIGKNVKTIGKNAFASCTKLKTVKGGAAVAMIGDSAFSGCNVLTTFPTLSKLQTIGVSAFKGCVRLAKITLGTAIKSIGKNAFYGCKALKTITVKTTKLTTKNVGTNAFKGIYKNATFKCPSSKLKAYRTLLMKKGAAKTCKFTK